MTLCIFTLKIIICWYLNWTELTVWICWISLSNFIRSRRTVSKWLQSCRNWSNDDAALSTNGSAESSWVSNSPLNNNSAWWLFRCENSVYKNLNSVICFSISKSTNYETHSGFLLIWWNAKNEHIKKYRSTWCQLDLNALVEKITSVSIIAKSGLKHGMELKYLAAHMNRKHHNLLNLPVALVETSSFVKEGRIPSIQFFSTSTSFQNVRNWRTSFTCRCLRSQHSVKISYLRRIRNYT